MARKRTLFQRQLPTVLIPLVAGITLAPKVANGQIVPDDTLGAESSTVNQDVVEGIDLIEGGATRGGNLFHSFSEFNVGEGRGAYFANPDAIANILSRVTGSKISEIMGTLGVLGDANLFLINPNGIVFGENARLDVGGSFFASTADSLLFDNGFEFSASNPQAPPLLTVNIPIGLGFRDNPGSITNQSVAQDFLSGNSIGLQVPTGKSIGLVGGNVNFSDGGRLTAAEGRVELGGLAGVGTVELGLDGNNISLNFPTDSQLANVTLAENARVSVRGLGKGNILVNANTFTASDGGSLVAGTEGIDDGGDIIVNAREIMLSGVGTDEVGSGLYNQALPGSLGNAGNILVNTRSFRAASGGTIRANSGGAGNGGNVEIISTDSVELVDGNIGTPTFAPATGNAGNISITTGTYLASGAEAFLWSGTFEGGRNAGNISVTADSVTLLNGSSIDSSNSSGTGNAGIVDIQARNTVSFSGGSYIFASSAGTGNGADVTVRAGDAVSLVNSDISSTVSLGTASKGGNISITAKSLSMTDNSDLGASDLRDIGAEEGGAGNITVRTTDFVSLDNDSSMNVFASGTGAGGNIEIDTGRLSVRNGSDLLANTLSNQPAGNLIVNASDSVEVSGSKEDIPDVFFGSSLSLDTTGNGNAGNITINTKKLTVRDGARISSNTSGKGSAGTILINASESVELTGTTPKGLDSSQITTDTGGEGNGGNIQITTGRLVIQDGSRVSSLTSLSSSGKGGNLEVNASESVEIIGVRLGLFITSPSRLDASTDGTGDAGNILINTPQLNLSDRGQITTTTSGSSKAGDIILNIRDSLNLTDSTIEASTTSKSSGNGGSIIIDPVSVNLNDNAAIAVNSEGTGDGGSIFLTAEDLTLNNNSQISAATASGKGGNIDLAISDILLLDNNSPISAKAENNGDGGNITIAADFTILKESDIIANAFEGTGGNINITTQGLFQRNSEITASSAFGVDGVVETNTPEIDPSQGLVELPENVQDPNKLIAQNACKQGTGSSLIVTGRGGLPPSSSQSFNSNWLDVDLLQPIPPEEKTSSESNQEANSISSSDASNQNQLVPAEGWVVNEKGELFLVAYKSTNDNNQRQNNIRRCQPK